MQMVRGLCRFSVPAVKTTRGAGADEFYEFVLDSKTVSEDRFAACFCDLAEQLATMIGDGSPGRVGRAAVTSKGTNDGGKRPVLFDLVACCRADGQACAGPFATDLIEQSGLANA